MTQIELIFTILLSFLVVVVLLETFILLQLRHHYNHLLKFGNKSGLMDVLEGIQKTLSAHESRSLKLEGKITSLEGSAKGYLQHLVVKRFNPFGNTGGDQSFILGLLDGEQNGVVITSLHSRENTRFYVKSISGGEGSPHPLSEEEKKVLKKG